MEDAKVLSAKHRAAGFYGSDDAFSPISARFILAERCATRIERCPNRAGDR